MPWVNRKFGDDITTRGGNKFLGHSIRSNVRVVENRGRTAQMVDF